MKTPLTSITGIGPAAATTLTEYGFPTAESIATSNVQSLSHVPGFGPIRAAKTIAAALTIASKEEPKLKPKDKKKKKSKKTKKKDSKQKPGKKKQKKKKDSKKTSKKKK